MLETGTIVVGGIALTYDIVGEGQPLVLVHGGLGDRRMWDDQMDAFARHYRVIRYDQQGYGATPLSAGPVAYHEDLYHLLQALGISCAHVLGLSYGAQVVTDFVLTYPQMVSSFISVSSVIGGISEDTLRRIDEADQAAEAGDLDRAVELELQIWIDGVGRKPDEVDPAVREKVRAMNRAVWDHASADVQIVKLDPPAQSRLAGIQAPTLIVVGELDVPEAQATGDLLQHKIAGARQVMIPRAAHHPQMEQPAIFNGAILEFLAAISS